MLFASMNWAMTPVGANLMNSLVLNKKLTLNWA
jgi:hypothetical protein